MNYCLNVNENQTSPIEASRHSVEPQKPIFINENETYEVTSNGAVLAISSVKTANSLKYRSLSKSKGRGSKDTLQKFKANIDKEKNIEK